MLIVFQVCFFVGIGLTILSFVFGQFFDFLGIDGLDLDFEIIGVDLLLPFSPILYILFSTVFGGVGWILMIMGKISSSSVIIIISTLAGLAVGTLLQKCVISPLKKAQNTSAPEQDELIGLEARVTETIHLEGYGEVAYSIHGNSFVAPAKATKKEEILRGSAVKICWIEDYVFYVSNISQ